MGKEIFIKNDCDCKLQNIEEETILKTNKKNTDFIPEYIRKWA